MPTTDLEFLKKLLATFRIEGQEHMGAISSGLVELERSTSDVSRKEIVETIFREAHSLKGAARAVNLGGVEAVCQLLEAAFAEIKTQKPAFSAEVFDKLHRLVATAEAEMNAALAAQVPETGDSARRVQFPMTPADAKSALPDTVRVSTSKLTAILSQAEEFLASKTTSAHRLAQLEEIRASLGLWEREWRRVRPQVRELRRSHQGNGAAFERPIVASRDVIPVLAFVDRNEQVLESLARQLALLAASLDGDRRVLDRRVSELLDEIKRVSMLPFSTLLEAFPKVVRELCRDCGKDAVLVVQGGGIEAGRRVLEEIKDPLMHLVRNCIDHGIEPPNVRERTGKAPRATITIAISPKNGDRIELAIGDDGAGIDAQKVAAAAVEQHVISEEEARSLDERQALALIFQSGLSTCKEITAVSGRGLGLAIVREKVEGLGGQISVETRPGRGTTFRLILPLTLSTFRGILVRASGQIFVIPTMYVQRAVRVAHEEIRSVENRPTIQLDGQAISVVWLTEALGIPATQSEIDPKRKWPGLLLERAGERIAFLTDQILHDQEVLVKSLGPQLRRVRNVSGASVMEDGTIALVLNVADLMRSAVGITTGVPAAGPAEKPKSILVVEDSITARTLLKGILGASGYAVTTAVNGLEAFDALKAGAFDLVVSDVEMPRMSGVDLTAKIRADHRLAELPVVLVTALDSSEDRRRGAEAGANAYIVKSSFDQSNLLEVVHRLI